MVTAEKIQSDFRGASYSQSQILVQGDIDTTDFLDGNYEMQYGQAGSDNKGLNDDRFVIKVGANARVESVHEIVQKAIDSEEFSVTHGENLTHEWTITNSFLLHSGDFLDVNWIMDQSLVSPSLDVLVLWYDSSNELIGTDKLTNFQTSSEVSGDSSASVEILDNSYKARLKFSYIQDASEDSLVQSIEAHDREKYVFVQSLTDTFNLTYQAKTFSLTTDDDIHNLYDYLYQRELDVADPFTGESYSDEIKHILNKDLNGDYVSSVIRIYIGPTTSHELDNDGLEFMRSELDADIPDVFVENFTISTTGGHVLTSVTVNEIQKTQITSTLIAILFAAITLVLIYRSLDLGVIAVFPTPGSPISTGLFFVLRESICSTLRISSSRPITGSSLFSEAIRFKLLAYFSKLL